MPQITVHYNAACQDCVRQGKRTKRLDWLGRIEISAAPSPIGTPPKGEIVVVDNRTREIYTGVYAMRKICLQAPVLFPLGLLLHLPPVRKLIGGKKPGCNGDACEIPGEPGTPPFANNTRTGQSKR